MSTKDIAHDRALYEWEGSSNVHLHPDPAVRSAAYTGWKAGFDAGWDASLAGYPIPDPDPTGEYPAGWHESETTHEHPTGRGDYYECDDTECVSTPSDVGGGRG